MKIGIPKGMYIYEKPILFEKFFTNLGIDIVYSNNTDKKIVENGINYSIDEACLASKVFIGHVKDLVDRKQKEGIDYIFIPRICSFGKKQTICVKFFATYDICKNIFDADFVTLNIDYQKKENEFKAFVKLGTSLGFKYTNVISSYMKARNMQMMYERKKVREQYELINESIETNKPNVLIVSHPYIGYDKYMGGPVKKYLNDLGANIIFADVNDSYFNKNSKLNYKKVTNSIYWKPSIHLINGIEEYKNDVDGIIYLTVFPCGPDSLVNELLIRRLHNVPSINLILDEQEAGAGLYTRLESFYDILEQNKNIDKVSGE